MQTLQLTYVKEIAVMVVLLAVAVAAVVPDICRV